MVLFTNGVRTRYQESRTLTTLSELQRAAEAFLLQSREVSSEQASLRVLQGEFAVVDCRHTRLVAVGSDEASVRKLGPMIPSC